ncbi:MAG: LytTR family DNA-binding domain-containing protein [Angelakisella sp.]
MFYIALCDDEQQALDTLTGYMAELPSGYKYEAVTFKNGAELAELYQKGRRFHLVVLDMMMQPMDGIETAMRIRRYDTDVPILIVTATPEYAIDGYRVNASRYILKPVEKACFLEEVKAMLDRAGQNKGRYYSVSCNSGIIKLELDDICYFESDMRTITARMNRTTNNLCKSYSFTGHIKELEQQLAPQDFVRVHKSYIVNLRCIHRIFKDTITMSDGSSVPLSKNRSKEVHALLLRYMENSL